MRTLDEKVVRAPADICFRVAADVEKWPTLLAHYRWVRFLRQEDFATGLVEMAAWRPFGPVGWPTWWISEMRNDPITRTISYQHVYGVTRGMDVLWQVIPLDDSRTQLRILHEWSGPEWPFVGRLAADSVIGPYFVSAIAGRTLAGVAHEAELQATTAPSGPTDRGSRT